MHHAHFLQDLAIVMIVAAVVTIVFRQFKQPVVLGYILAGVIIGPHTPPFPMIADEGTIKTLSELGVIFLMFALGLEFSLKKLGKVGATAFIGATLEILLMSVAGYQLGRAFGWSQMDSVFLGAILAISSTTIIIKALEELGKTKERFAQLIFGILIVEDMLAIVMIALLSGFATTGTLAAGDIGLTVGKLSAFLGVLLVAGLIAVPRLLNYLGRFKSDEMLLVTVVGLCFGVSLLALKLGYSVALGAFLIGAIIAEARQIAKIEALVQPVRDLFSAVFFVSIGLLIDPAMLLHYAGPIVAITAVVIVGKVLACAFGTFMAGNDQRTSLRVGMGLAQIGEFSFIIAGLGLTLKATSEFLYPIAVAVSALTTLATPYLIRWSDPLSAWLDRVVPRSVDETLDAYTEWVGQLAASREGATVGGFVRKWLWQIALNLLLVAGIFIAAVALRTRATAAFAAQLGGDDWVKAALWLAALLLSLPMLIAVFRKLQATAMLLAEVSVRREVAKARTDGLRAAIATVITVAGVVGLVLFLLLLSSAILPSAKLGFVVVLVVVASTVLLRRSFVRLHSRAQGALRETLEQAPAPHHESAPTLPALLRDAQLETIEIAEDSPAAGKLIRELGLRTATGASIVGLERATESLVNPSADEEIKTGDRLLLLGTNPQLAAARENLKRFLGPEGA